MVKIVSRGDPIEPIYLNNLRVAAQGWGVVSGLAVSQRSAGANMSVDVAAGDAWINDANVTKGSTTNVAIIAAHASYDRYDLVVINSSGTISVIDGTAAATSYANDYDLETNNAILLAEVYVPATDTTIEDAQITDKKIQNFLDGSAKIPGGLFNGIHKEYVIGDTVLHQDPNIESTSSTTYVKLQQLTIDTLYKTPKTLRIRFGMKFESTPVALVYGKIYKNGSPVGTERSTDISILTYYSEDLSFAQGDTIEVWGKAPSGNLCRINYLGIQGTETPIPVGTAIVDGNIGLADPVVVTIL